MKVVDIEYERRDLSGYTTDLLGVGFLGSVCVFQFYHNRVIQWSESGEFRGVARFKITKLHNVRNK